jgi:hypothetical protein
MGRYQRELDYTALSPGRAQCARKSTMLPHEQCLDSSFKTHLRRYNRAKPQVCFLVFRMQRTWLVFIAVLTKFKQAIHAWLVFGRWLIRFLAREEFYWLTISSPSPLRYSHVALCQTTEGLPLMNWHYAEDNESLSWSKYSPFMESESSKFRRVCCYSNELNPLAQTPCLQNPS